MSTGDNGIVSLRVDTTTLARRVLAICVVLEVAFVFFDYHLNYAALVDIGAIRRMFNIAREDSLASWFGTTQTLMCGLTLWLIYASARQRSTTTRRRAGWLTLAIFFTYMAVDDGAQLHERLGSTFKALMGGAEERAEYYPSYTWQLVFGPAFVVLGLFTFVFLWSEFGQRRLRILLLVSMFCWGAALGLDFIEGLEEDHPWNLYTLLTERYALDEWALDRFDEDAYDAIRHFSKSLEEAIEMLAMSILWFLFMRHLAVEPGDLRVQFL